MARDYQLTRADLMNVSWRRFLVLLGGLSAESRWALKLRAEDADTPTGPGSKPDRVIDSAEEGIALLDRLAGRTRRKEPGQ